MDGDDIDPRTHHGSDWGLIRHLIHHRAGDMFENRNPIQLSLVGSDWVRVRWQIGSDGPIIKTKTLQNITIYEKIKFELDIVTQCV